MRIHYSFDTLGTIKNGVVTTGSFDGVHVGHKVIINRLNELAARINGESVLITFHPHPRKVLYPDGAGKELKLINTQREKIELLRKTGLDHLVIITFTREFSQTTSHDFVTRILLEKINAKIIVVGFNHHFGHNREGDYQYLYRLSRDHGFEVEEIPEQDIQNESVSSTKIRKALKEGNIRRANAYLDHYYMIIGRLYTGHSMFRKQGFETFSTAIEEDIKLIPPAGIYAVSVEEGHAAWKGMCIVHACDHHGIKEHYTHEIPDIHLMDEIPGNLEGQCVRIYFHKGITTLNGICDDEQLGLKLKIAKEEIGDLIY